MAGEHLRPAEHEEVSEALRIKAALLQLKECADADFEHEVEDTGPEPSQAVGDIAMEAEDEDEMVVDGDGNRQPLVFDGFGHVPPEQVAQARLRESALQKETRKRSNLDDVPLSIKNKAVKTHSPGSTGVHEQYLAKQVKPGLTDKALEKEIPWNLIKPEEKELFKQAEDVQWEEHIKFGAVKPLSVEESRRVEEQYGRDRILTSRFLYRDKNLAKRRTDPSIACKAKARLCVGGQRDPDLGVVEMAVDAPTSNRHSLLLGLVVALARGWAIAIGDIRAAFLNGVEAPRRLFFRQPVRGIRSLEPGQLVEIVKGVFGLSTSPKLWWLKLSKDLLSIRVVIGDEVFIVEQNEVDPCAFRLVEEKARRVSGMVFTHVDDLMVMGEPALLAAFQQAVAEKFPVDDWESGSFEYVGCEYRVGQDCVEIKQTNYVETRLNKISIPSGLRDEDEVGKEHIDQHRSVVGCLSWLAKQTRPDLQFMVAQAQRVQGRPSLADIKAVNRIVDQAKRFKDQGIKIVKIPEEHMTILGYHDAAWANVPLDGRTLEDVKWEGDTKMSSQLAFLVFVADKRCLNNQAAPAAVLDWRSHGSARVCRSTFAGETMACGEAMETALYMRSILLSFLEGRLVKEDEAGAMMGIHLLTDCKSLFDHLQREGVPRPPSERRLALDLASIRQTLMIEARHEWTRRYGTGNVTPEKPCKVPIHWVPTDKQLADILTKHLNPASWWETVSSGTLSLPFVPKASFLDDDT